MTHAYAEDYLNDAMQNLGEAFDYAVNACKIDIEEFMQYFIVGRYAEQFGNGNPKIISGMSGTELAMNIISESGKNMDFPESQTVYDYSAEYWCGWILAYYQWYTARSFKNIYDYISMKEVYKLYPTLHEAPEDKFADTANAIISRKIGTTALQAQRKRTGLTQAQLAAKANVNLRTLQQYELGTKSINKASVQTVMALCNALGCKAEDILEYI
ncbi:MAG: helix-turn-helix domain-containing protein [Lachnospiraceae bacterium]|nr:helix-turn-helix domain-containing protein [Lachnospiraceae bacterium]